MRGRKLWPYIVFESNLIRPPSSEEANGDARPPPLAPMKAAGLGRTERISEGSCTEINR